MRWSEIGLPNGTATVRDLWARKDRRVHRDDGQHFNTRRQARVPPHGAALYRITPVGK